MAQQASPNVIGQMLDWRAQFIACSTVVVITFSSMRASIQGCVDDASDTAQGLLQ
jgi:predicted MFS family arabinose efflux permease